MKKQMLSLAVALSLCAAMTAGASAAPARALETGADYSVMLKEDGSLWAWGRNDKGQVGDGSTADRTAPVKVMENVVSAYAGYGYSVALKKDGTLWAWGGADGAAAPAKLMEGVKALSLGGSQAIALKNDGTLWNWGPMTCLDDGRIWYDWSRPAKQLTDVIVPDMDQCR